MNTLEPNTAKPVLQEKGLIPEGVKLALILILLLAVAYLFYDNSRIKKSQQLDLIRLRIRYSLSRVLKKLASPRLPANSRT